MDYVFVLEWGRLSYRFADMVGFWLLFVFMYFSFVLVCVFGLLEQFESCGVSLFTDPKVEMVFMVGTLARVSRCVRNWYP